VPVMLFRARRKLAGLLKKKGLRQSVFVARGRRRRPRDRSRLGRPSRRVSGVSRSG
jgi:hypothetical protein